MTARASRGRTARARKLALGGLCAALALSGSCTVGAPPGFSAGSEWSFPLVDPLDNGLLVTPVMIHGKGPYLFAIDPEAQDSIIDERVAIEAGLRMDRGYATRLRGDDGQLRARFNAEMLDIQIGSLRVERRMALVVPHETLAVLGHDIRGVLGRKFIEDSLVFGFDRDRGIGWLETVAHFKPRPDAARLDVKILRSADDHAYGADSVGPSMMRHDSVGGASGDSQGDNRVPEVQVKAAVAGKPLTLDVTLGAIATRVRPKLWDALQLAPAARQIVEVDPTGARRVVAISGTPAQVAVGAIQNPATPIGAYENHQEMDSSEQFLDGTLALDFFAPYSVVADWDAKAFFLSPRGDAAAQTPVRIGRWGDLARCPHLGCVTVSLVEPPAPAVTSNAPGVPASAPFILHVVRDPDANTPLEVRLRASTSGVPDLVVELPAGVREALAPLRGELHGVRYDVIDASPFAQACGTPNTGCVH